jgi:hypothetical protein
MGALTTGHTGLTHWGIVLIAASPIGAAAGMLVAARRGQPVRPGPWPGRYRLIPGRTRNDRQRAGARPSAKEALIFRRIIGQDATPVLQRQDLPSR